MIEEVVDELLLFGVKNLGNDTFIVVPDDLSIDICVTILV